MMFVFLKLKSYYSVRKEIQMSFKGKPMKKFLPFFLIILFAIACSNTGLLKHDYSNNNFDVTYVKANLEFLASDYLEGRDATSNSEKVASQFIAGELLKYGLQPFGDSGTFFQNVPFNSRRLDESSNITFYNDDSMAAELKTW